VSYGRRLKMSYGRHRRVSYGRHHDNVLKENLRVSGNEGDRRVPVCKHETCDRDSRWYSCLADNCTVSPARSEDHKRAVYVVNDLKW
jgi:hypothetical protein